MNIQIKDYNINYIDEGSGSAILLLHGWGANLNCFDELILLLKNKYRVLALDLPGFGKSDMIKNKFCVDDYVDIVETFLEAKDIKEVILIGHSYGGRIIIKLNSKNNLKFNILKNVLIDAAGIKENRDFIVKIRIMIFKFLKKCLYVLPISYDKKKNLEMNLKRKFGSSDYNSAPRVLQETLVASVNEDLSSYLKNMKETLLIWGKNDTATPLWMAKKMELEIENSGLVLLNGGHFSFLDDRFTFMKVIKSYFAL